MRRDLVLLVWCGITAAEFLMISNHESSALGHERILEFHKFYSEYHIWLEVGSERFNMKIRVYETNDGRFFFVQSHSMRSLVEEDGSNPTRLGHETAHLALSNAVETITTYYDDAAANGLEPSMDWFIPNMLF